MDHQDSSIPTALLPNNFRHCIPRERLPDGPHDNVLSHGILIRALLWQALTEKLEVVLACHEAALLECIVELFRREEDRRKMRSNL